jgi:hypothetical protein
VTVAAVSNDALEATVVREFKRLCPTWPTYRQAEEAVRLALVAALSEIHAMEALALAAGSPCECGHPQLCSRPNHEEGA